MKGKMFAIALFSFLIITVGIFVFLQCTQVDFGGNIDVTVKAYGPGITDPSGTVKKRVDDIVPLIAIPDECAQFDQWEVLTGSTNVENAASPTTTITVKENPITLIAHFSKKTFTLNIESTSGGNTIPAGTTTVTCGVSTSVYANSEGDYNFTNWSIESGSAQILDPIAQSTKVTLDTGDATIRANFGRAMRSLGVSCPQEGSYTVDGKYSPSNVYVLSSGIPAAIKAIPGSCYEFSQWDLVSGSATIDDYKSAETSITLTSGNASIKASFARIRYNLTISSGTGGTTSPITGTTVECGVAKDILAIPGDCMDFDKWEKVSGNLTIDNAASASTKVTLIEGNGEVKAVFKSKTYTVTMAVSSSAGGTAAVTNTTHPGTTYYCGDVIRITAAPNAGYDFTGWSGDISGSTNTYDFSIIKAVSITANFSLKKFTLTITNNGYCTTTPSGDRIVDYNQALGISASSTNPAYNIFEGWSVVSGTGVAFADSSSPSTSVRLTAENATIKASYGQGSITWYANTGGPTSQIEHVVYPNIGATITITTAQSNYCPGYCNPPLSFVTWQVSGTGSVTFVDQKSPKTDVTFTGLGNVVITPCYYPTCQ